MDAGINGIDMLGLKKRMTFDLLPYPLSFFSVLKPERLRLGDICISSLLSPVDHVAEIDDRNMECGSTLGYCWTRSHRQST